MMAQQFCIDAVIRASGNKLSAEEVNSVIEEVDRARRRSSAEGLFDKADDQLRAAIDEKAKETVILAALQRKQAALNIIARDKVDGYIDELVAGGLTYPRAILSLMEGSIQGVRLGRVSVMRLRTGYESKYLGGMMQEITKERPHIQHLFNDEKLMDDTILEMIDGLGTTGNADARFLAEKYSIFLEKARLDSNRLGANIGKLEGWAPQAHDDQIIMKAGKAKWTRDIKQHIDWERTGKDLDGTDEARQEFLESIYDTIVTNVDNRINAMQRGTRHGPANLASGLARHRVLHFKNGSAANSYRKQYGYGNLNKAIFKHFERSARINAEMRMFGPNPVRMIESLVESTKKKIKASAALTDKQKSEQATALTIMPENLSESGIIGKAMVEMSGFTLGAPANASRVAHYTRAGRAWMATTKLGSAVWTAMGTDQIIAATAAAMRGSNFLPSLGRHMAALMRGRTSDERRQIAYLYGVGFNSFIDNITTPIQAFDAHRGVASKLMMQAFKYTGFSWETDVTRMAAANMIDHELGSMASLPFSQIPKRYAHTFQKHGITADIWEPMRRATMITARGDKVLLPDLISELPDEAFDGLVNMRIAGGAARRVTPKFRERAVADAKDEVEMALRGFVTDEINLANPIVDAGTRRVIFQGHRSGTATGEVLRSIMQFKSFAVVFNRNVLGRAMFGGQGATRGKRLLNGVPHIGALLAFLTLAGYGRIVAVDTMMGRWPPRDPMDWKTMAASALQGGALGIYGDFLFSENDRFGRSPQEMAAGPLFGEVSDVIGLIQSARAGEFGAGMASTGLNLVQGNMPVINWWYTKAATNYLFMNALREAIKPGYIRRRDRRREREYGQRNIIPPGPFE